MRDNLLFHNIEEVEREDCTEVIYELLQEKLEIPDAKSTIKIERAHRVGRKRGVGVSLGQLLPSSISTLIVKESVVVRVN